MINHILVSFFCNSKIRNFIYSLGNWFLPLIARLRVVLDSRFKIIQLPSELFQSSARITLVAGLRAILSLGSETLCVGTKLVFFAGLRPGLNVASNTTRMNTFGWFTRRIVLLNKIAEREWRVLNSHSSKHKLFNMISIQFGTCKMRRLNQLNGTYFNSMRVSRIFDWSSRIFD